MNRTLDKLRIESELSIEQMANHVGISRLDAIEMLNGLVKPPPEYVKKWKMQLLSAFMHKLNEIKL